MYRHIDMCSVSLNSYTPSSKSEAKNCKDCHQPQQLRLLSTSIAVSSKEPLKGYDPEHILLTVPVVGMVGCYISTDIICLQSAKPKLATATGGRCGVHKHRLSVRLA